MPSSVRCPTCGTLLEAPDDATGHPVECPNCHSAFVVPVKLGPPPLPIVLLEDNYKDCPFCGEQVKASAKRCKHCGETIDVTLRMAEDARRAAERQPAGPTVFMNAGGGGGSSSGRRRRTVVVKPPFPHNVHLVLSILTCGFWLPIYLIHYFIYTVSK